MNYLHPLPHPSRSAAPAKAIFSLRTSPRTGMLPFPAKGPVKGGRHVG